MKIDTSLEICETLPVISHAVCTQKHFFVVMKMSWCNLMLNAGGTVIKCFSSHLRISIFSVDFCTCELFQWWWWWLSMNEFQTGIKVIWLISCYFVCFPLDLRHVAFLLITGSERKEDKKRKKWAYILLLSLFYLYLERKYSPSHG